MKLSRHFVENWEKRVGNTPTLPMVQNIISRSVRVQEYRTYKLVNKRIYVRLAVYWCPDLDIIITIDKGLDTAVSVLTPEVIKEVIKNGQEPLCRMRNGTSGQKQSKLQSLQ